MFDYQVLIELGHTKAEAIDLLQKGCQVFTWQYLADNLYNVGCYYDFSGEVIGKLYKMIRDRNVYLDNWAYVEIGNDFYFIKYPY